MRRALSLFLCSLLLPAAASSAFAEKRIALVIGNSAHASSITTVGIGLGANQT